MKVLGNRKRGLCFVISAPAGTGKTTLAAMLVQEFSCIVESISCTTRPPRGDEREGKDYYFLTPEQFQKNIEKGVFLEFAEVFGYYYGTSQEAVEQELARGKHVILVIDTQGAEKIRAQIPAIFVFLMPPSLDALRERLTKRKTESKENIEKRLSWAQQEMAMVSNYDYVIINDDLTVAYQVLKSVVIAEEHKVEP